MTRKRRAPFVVVLLFPYQFRHRRNVMPVLTPHVFFSNPNPFLSPSCGTSVLDRLNPLLEPGGVLPLTECGTSLVENESTADTISGGDVADDHKNRPSSPSTSSHRVIRPHPNFRLFLTADPSCGEVSRAMRNRCVEVCLLDVAPAVAIIAPTVDGAKASASPSEGHGGATAIAATEHVADLLSLVRAAGLSDPGEASAAVAAHSALVARRSKGKANASSGEGPASRSLLLWARLAAASRSRGFLSQGDGDALRRCMPLAYPGLNPGVGSTTEDRIAEAALAACLASAGSSALEIATSSAGLLESLVACGWKDFVHDSAASLVAQGSKLLQITVAAGDSAGMEAGAPARGLLAMVVDGLDSKPCTSTSSCFSAESDLSLKFGDAALLHSTGQACSSSKVSAELFAQAAVLFARSASPIDRHLRFVSASRVSSKTTVPAPLLASSFQRGVLAADVGEAVSWMMGVLMDSPASREASTMISEMSAEVDAQISGDGWGMEIASVGQAVLVSGNRWSPADPRSNLELFRSLQRVCRESVSWAPCGVLLRLVDASVGRRLPLLLAERAELTEARARISSGRAGEAGLGWLGLSCLICEGGRDSSRVGGGARCPETRLARSVLAPNLLPLFRAVDGLVEGLVSRQAAVLAEGGDGVGGGEVFLGAVQEVLYSRDTVSRLLCSCSSSKSVKPGADASAGAGKKELLFAWDPFLVSWRWLQQAIDSLRSVLSDSSGVEDLPKVPAALATLGAVGARVDAAVSQHAGGAEPTRNTLWKHGPRAAAPSSAAGAISLARIGRLADEFRILPASGSAYNTAEPTVVSLGSLMREAHPALCVRIDTRRELLHALCTLHWVASNEQADGPSGGQQALTTAIDLDSSAQPDDSLSFAERLPGVLEDTLKSARARFEAGHKGTRLGAAERQEDGLEHHQDDLEFGEKFDDFDTEAAEAVANATLLVVSGDGGGAAGGDAVAGGGAPGDTVSNGGVLQDWAVVQLSPLMEHWIAVEECQILSLLADLDVSSASSTGSPETLVAAGRVDNSNLAALMARIARLRSGILATPSLSPAAARPHQTLLWAWADSSTWQDVHSPLLKRLLPVALDSFGRRLWENIVGTPGAFSLQLAPPEMIVHSTEDGIGRQGSNTSGAAADAAAFLGPMQLLTLARSSFLLRFLATPTFRGGVVPGGGGGAGNAMDLTLMNASARLAQFRMAMRGVRDLAYGGACGGSGGALKPLVELSWSRLCRTLGAFDGLLVNANVDATPAGAASEAGAAPPATFVGALRTAGCTGAAPFVSWDSVQGPLRSALEACPDDRLTAQAESLVVPAVEHLAHAMEALGGPAADGPTSRVEASAGLGMALAGSLKLVLVLPSSPVDPGLRPALKKELLGERMEDVKGELTVRQWSSVLEGGGQVSHEVRYCFVR